METSEKFKYEYDETRGILFKYYYFDISLKDIEDSWYYAFENDIIPQGTRSFILDYRGAHLNMVPDETSKIAEFFKQHLEIFAGAKIAIIMEKPSQFIFPILVQMKDEGYISKPFSTMEAAIEWLSFW